MPPREPRMMEPDTPDFDSDEEEEAYYSDPFGGHDPDEEYDRAVDRELTGW